MNTKQDTRTARQIRSDAAAAKARRDVASAARKEHVERIGSTAKAIIAPLTFLAIALVALSASFSHLRDLGIRAGQDASQFYSPANTTPIVIDFMMLIASMQLRRVGITGTARFIARLCMTGGLLASIAGNLGSAWLTLPMGESTLMAVIRLAYAVAPAVVLWGAVEMLTHTRKTAKSVRKASLVRRLLVALVARVERRIAAPATRTETVTVTA